MGVGYQKFQAGSPDGYLYFGVISTPVKDYKFYDAMSWANTLQNRAIGHMSCVYSFM